MPKSVVVSSNCLQSGRVDSGRFAKSDNRYLGASSPREPRSTFSCKTTRNFLLLCTLSPSPFRFVFRFSPPCVHCNFHVSRKPKSSHFSCGREREGKGTKNQNGEKIAWSPPTIVRAVRKGPYVHSQRGLNPRSLGSCPAPFAAAPLSRSAG